MPRSVMARIGWSRSRGGFCGEMELGGDLAPLAPTRSQDLPSRLGELVHGSGATAAVSFSVR